ncbi:hypothetical protein VC87395_002251B, partial [Vibrio paracholerae 87395]
PKGALFINSI